MSNLDTDKNIDTSKFNDLMPESDERAICFEISKPISSEGYDLNFLPKLQNMIEEQGSAAILVYFKNYQGWEEEAALADMAATFQFGAKIRKLAFVNAPEKYNTQLNVRQPLIDGDFKFFEESELQTALEWVKS